MGLSRDWTGAVQCPIRLSPRLDARTWHEDLWGPYRDTGQGAAGRDGLLSSGDPSTLPSTTPR